MKNSKNYMINIITTGFAVLLITMILLFWQHCFFGIEENWYRKGLSEEVELARGLLRLETIEDFDNIEETPYFVACIYISENLQPPILSLASYFKNSSWTSNLNRNRDGNRNHNSFFIPYNSFIEIIDRRGNVNMIGGFFLSLLTIMPSILLASFLAWRIRVNAAVVGLSSRAKLFWTIGTICFGLVAFITYRLTRPKITQVTCENCGKLRRPDMNNCHHCSSKWHIPELIPPTWRVLDK
ncbi:hypothetical protein ACFL3G_01575 [Planctomycetota bacterium]